MNRIASEIGENFLALLDNVSEEYGLPDPGRYGKCHSYGIATSIPHCLGKDKIY